MEKKAKKVATTLLCLMLALSLVSCKNEQIEEIDEETTKEVIKQEEVKEEKKEEPIVEEVKEESKSEKKIQDITEMYFWVVFYDQYDNELQREALKYGTVPEYKSWLPEGFDKWIYKRSGKDVGTFKPITGNTYFKAVCHEVYHEHHGSDEPSGPTSPYTTIWQGNTTISEWGQSMTDLAYGGYDWSTVEPGTILHIEATADPTRDGEAMICLDNGNWNVLSGTKNLVGANYNGNFYMNDDSSYFEIKITQAMIDDLVDNDGLLICGIGFNITAIKLREKQEASYTVIWQGHTTISSWGETMADLANGGYDWSTVEPGTSLLVGVFANPGETNNAQIRFANYNNWSALPGTKEILGADADGNFLMNNDTLYYEFKLTQAMIDDMVNNNGFIICGTGFDIEVVKLGNNQVIKYPILSEIILWEGEIIADDWGSQPYVLSDGGAELQNQDAQVGDIINFYITVTEPSWVVQIFEGHWASCYQGYASLDNSASDVNNNKLVEIDEDNKAILQIVLTQEMLDAAYVQQWWGGTFLLNGDNVICNKVTLGKN